MSGDLPIRRIYRSASAPPALSSVAAPVIVTLEQSLKQEVTVWARIRAQASQQYQEYQDEKKRKQDRIEKELLILRRRQEAQEKAKAEIEADLTLALAVSVSAPITLSWEREIEEWAQIRAQATERYEKYHLEREEEQELAEDDEHLPIVRQEDDEHLPVLGQEQEPKIKSKVSMILRWLSKCHR